MKRAQLLLKQTDSDNLRKFSVIIDISQSINSTLDYNKVLQNISDGMSELFEIETAAIYILEENEKLFLSATTPPLSPDMPNVLREAYLNNHPHIKKAINTCEPVFISDTANARLSEEEKKVVELRQLRSILYIPFVIEKKALGVLILGTSNNSRNYTKQEIEIGQILSNQLATAIQNSRLHTDLYLHKENLEETVDQRTQELMAMNEELQMMNEELYEKNELILKQKEELEGTLAELKSMQLKLIQTEKMASVGILMSGIAHEINNPLNFIIGSYYGLDSFFNGKAREYKDEVSVLLNGLKTGVDRASEIVKGLNHFSRDSENYNEECNIHDIIDNGLLMLKNQFDSHIQIKKTYDKKGIFIKGNVGKLNLAFTSILLNSIQSIEKEGFISISTEWSGNVAIISIQDSGKGISKDNLPRITDPFFTTKSPQEAKGLGLSIAYRIIQDHHGQIEFESDLKKGTKVIIKLPKLVENG